MPVPQLFVNYSAKIGANPLLIQGAGGNTSYKEKEIMWIKASGTELKDAKRENLFIPVDIKQVKEEINGKGDGTCQKAVTDPNCKLRPSIETPFHALIAYKYVVHTHSINTIAHTLTKAGLEDLEKKLDGLNWCKVDYCQPGMPLTLNIKKVIEASTESKTKPVPNIYILANHGLIVAADNLEEVGSLMTQVDEKLELKIDFQLDTPTPTIPPSPSPDWEYLPEYSLMATNELFRSRISAGSYYPDHVVFLGPALPVIPKTALEKYLNSKESPPRFPVVVVDGVGVLIKKKVSPTSMAMLTCLYEVLSRVAQSYGNLLNFIGTDQEDLLLNWDAETYRQKLAKF